MLAYLATKGDYLRDASTIEDVIRDAVKAKLNLNVGEREYLSWRNSLGNAMSHVMHSQLIPEDAGIAIEYRVNGRQYRLDFVVSGLNSKGSESLVIIELKQWTDIEFSDLDEHVRTALGGGIRDTRHPSYQAWSYKSHLEQFNEYVYENNVQVFACAYLHNLKGNEVISDSRYENDVQKFGLQREFGLMRTGLAQHFNIIVQEDLIAFAGNKAAPGGGEYRRMIG